MEEVPERMDLRDDEPKQQMLTSLPPQHNLMSPALKPKQQIMSRITRNSRMANKRTVIRMMTLLGCMTNS